MTRIRLCARLSREWSKSICDDPWSPLQQAMPHDNNEFYLADDRRMGAFQHHSTVGRERVSDQLNAMNLKIGAPSVVCDKIPSSTTRFCTAAIPIKQHLVAVWTVWNSKAETPMQRAEREAKMITAFVLNGLGATENFSLLLPVACEMKDPEASKGVHESPCNRTTTARP